MAGPSGPRTGCPGGATVVYARERVAVGREAGTTMRTRVRWLWRWRRNPLKRPSDTTEARTLLAAVALMAAGAPAAGVCTAWSVQDALLQQRHDRHTASAVLTGAAPAVFAYDADGSERATVRWTAPDGSVHTGTATVRAGLPKGSTVTVWLDGRGGLTAEPAAADAAAVEGALAGGTAAGGVCVLLLGGVRLVRWRLDRRRAEEWEREWARIGPQWGRHRT